MIAVPKAGALAVANASPVGVVLVAVAVVAPKANVVFKPWAGAGVAPNAGPALVAGAPKLNPDILF